MGYESSPLVSVFKDPSEQFKLFLRVHEFAFYRFLLYPLDRLSKAHFSIYFNTALKMAESEDELRSDDLQIIQRLSISSLEEAKCIPKGRVLIVTIVHEEIIGFCFLS